MALSYPVLQAAGATFTMGSGQQWRSFRRVLMNVFASECDTSGSSLADFCMGTDMGGDNGGNYPAGVEGAKMQQLRRARCNRTWAALHTALQGNQLLLESMNVDFPNRDGLALWQALDQRFDAAPSQSDIMHLQAEWLALTIPKNVGFDEHTVQRLAEHMSVLNAQLPEDQRYSEETSVKRLLMSIKTASQHLSFAANTELESTAERGVCWRPAVPPAVPPLVHPGRPAQRDMLLTVRHFGQLWREGVKDNYIIKAASTSSSRPRVENALVARARGYSGGGGGGGSSARAPAFDLDASLDALNNAGVNIGAGDATTTDFACFSLNELRDAVKCYDCDGGGDGGFFRGFELAFLIDGNGTTASEIYCFNCKGAGHPASKCSSTVQPRTHEYVIAILQAALEKKGFKPGRAPTHGQRGPFRAKPRDERRARDSGRGSAPPPRRQPTHFGAVAGSTDDADYDCVVGGDEHGAGGDGQGHATQHALAAVQTLTYCEEHEEDDPFDNPFDHARAHHALVITHPERARELIVDSGATDCLADPAHPLLYGALDDDPWSMAGPLLLDDDDYFIHHALSTTPVKDPPTVKNPRTLDSIVEVLRRCLDSIVKAPRKAL